MDSVPQQVLHAHLIPYLDQESIKGLSLASKRYRWVSAFILPIKRFECGCREIYPGYTGVYYEYDAYFAHETCMYCGRPCCWQCGDACFEDSEYCGTDILVWCNRCR